MQFDLLDSEIEKNKKIEIHDKQMSFLPVHPLQEKYGQAEPTLTPCEFQIMHMVLSGRSIEDIGLKVFIGTHGVKYRLTNIYWKFGVENRLELILTASTKGLQFFVRDYDKKTKEVTLIKHAFHNEINLRAHDKDKNEKA